MSGYLHFEVHYIRFSVCVCVCVFVNYNENENENLPLLQNIILLVCDSLSGQSCLFMLAIYLFNHLLDFIFKFTGILGYNELQEVQAK